MSHERNGTGYVYVIQPELGGPFKAGWAVNPDERLRTLNAGTWLKLQLVATWPGTRGDELEMHSRFAKVTRRLRGEWFLPNVAAHEIILKLARRPVLALSFRLDGRLICPRCNYDNAIGWNDHEDRLTHLAPGEIDHQLHDASCAPFEHYDGR